jgi:hypothetical protein
MIRGRRFTSEKHPVEQRGRQSLAGFWTRTDGSEAV